MVLQIVRKMHMMDDVDRHDCNDNTEDDDDDDDE